MAGDFALSERAVANLIDNALHHNVADGTVWVTVDAQDDRAVLRVANTGPVIPPGQVGSLLLPFRRGGSAERAPRTRAPRGSDDGLGLGLSIVQAIAVAHGAAFSIVARPDGGLAAELSFPAVRPALPGPPGRLPNPPADRTIDTCHGQQGSPLSCSSTLASSPG